MKNIFNLAYAFLMAVALVCCDKPQTDEPDVPQDPVADFELSVSDVTSTSCHFEVVPADDQMTYVVMLVAKEDFDAYEDEYKYQDNDLEWFGRKAGEEGKTLNEWLQGFLHKGPFEGDEEGLMPGEDYYLYAYGLDAEGYFTTGVTKVLFSTPSICFRDLAFEIEVTDIDLTQARVNVKASQKDALFFVNVFSLQQYEEWGGGEAAFANHAAALVDYYITMGQTLEAMVTNLGSVGSASLIFDDLTDNTDYIAYAVGIDENFFVNSEATIVSFKTGQVAQSSNTFTIDITGTTFCAVQGTVTPSNGDPFICTIQSKAQLEQYGSDSEIMYDLIATYEKWGALEDVLYADQIVDLEAISSLSPETEYSVLCFGWDGAPTTDLTRVDFTTAAAGGNPRNQEISFALSDILHNKVTVNITPKLGLHYFYDCMPVQVLNDYIESEGTEDEAICRFIDERIDYGAEFFFCTRKEYLEDMGAAIGKHKWTFTGLEEDTEYLIVAATVNMNTGKIALRTPFKSDVFRTTVLIESDAAVTFVIDKYYDGTELAELDPQQFSKCKGQVMVPYTIVPNQSAAHWRTTFAYGEFASWAERDDILVELDYKSDTDRTMGYAVVKYDQIVSFLGMAENAEGYTGPFTIFEFKAKKGGAAPAREFIESLNK